MSKYVDPFTDFGFKRIFGQESSKRLLIGFLNALFEGELMVSDLVYLDKEQTPQTREERGVIYDIFCTTHDGKHFIVEMQNKNQVHFEDRALYYGARAIVRQGEKGEEWDYEYCPVFGIYLMNFVHRSLGKAFRTDCAVCKLHRDFPENSVQKLNPAQKVVEQTKNDPKHPVYKDEILTNKLRMIFLQMPLFNKTVEECITNLDKWTYLVKNMNKISSIPWESQDELFKELAKVSNVAALTPEERFAYETNLRIYRDNIACLEASYEEGHETGYSEGHETGYSEGHETGYSEGHETGYSEGKRSIAKSMLSNGISKEMIMKCTNLSLEEIDGL